MKTITIINFRRLFLLIRRQLLSQANSWLVSFAAVAGTLLIISLLVAVLQPTSLPALTALYFTILFLGGYIFTSNIFGEMHHSGRSYQYLTLPVSTTERLLSAWLITALLFPLIGLISMALIILLANLVMDFTLDVTPFQSIFNTTSIKIVRIYIITQSVFLLGAAYFKSFHFLKTLLALFLISMVVWVATAITAFALFNPLGDNGGVQIAPNELPELEQFIVNYFPRVARIMFYYVTVPFFLVTTWFSIKERQV